jgi:hypothetical protein
MGVLYSAARRRSLPTDRLSVQDPRSVPHETGTLNHAAIDACARR